MEVRDLAQILPIMLTEIMDQMETAILDFTIPDYRPGNFAYHETRGFSPC